MNTALNEKLDALRVRLEADEPGSKYGENPGAYNAKLAKLMARLKKDLGAQAIRQNYKGTGQKAHRRQIWVNFGDMDSIDVWLDSGYVQVGGVIQAPAGMPAAERIKKYEDDDAETIYKWLVGSLQKVKEFRAGKKESLEQGEELEETKELLPSPKELASAPDAEVVNLAQALSGYPHKQFYDAQREKLFQQAMQRIKDEGLLSDSDQAYLWRKWKKGGL